MTGAKSKYNRISTVPHIHFHLQPLLDTQLLAEHPGMFELVAGFLEQGDYFKGKSEISRRVRTFFKGFFVIFSYVYFQRRLVFITLHTFLFVSQVSIAKY